MKETYLWYQAHQNRYPIPKIDDVTIINNHFGYKDDPPYEDVEKYDLRFVDRCTLDELFDKYF